MNTKRLIALFFGVILFYSGTAPLFAQQMRELEFQGDNPSIEDVGMVVPPLLSEIFTDEGDYFLVRGEKIFLRKDTRRIAVKFKRPAFERLQELSGRTELQSDFIKQVLNIAVADIVCKIEMRIEKMGLAIIDTKGASAELPQLPDARIQGIAAADSVQYAAPVFLSKTTFEEIIPTDELLVRFAPDFGRDELERFCEQHDLTYKRRTNAKLNVYVLSVNSPKTRSILKVANALNGLPGVVWAQPNFAQKIELHSLNDPLYPNQWHLENTGQSGNETTVDADVDAEKAWAIQTGSPDITIAIVDTGVDLGHEDLDIWINPGEIADNGIDDDGNGYTDDTRGWDFYDNDNTPAPDYGDYHGTACAGVAAAKGDNGIGGAGIAYGSKILPIKISGGPEINFVTGEAIGNAIIYAADHADVISCSWHTASNEYIFDAIDYAVESGRSGKGTPVFFSTGNSAARRGLLHAFPFIGLPVGFRTVQWEYHQNASGENNYDAAWLDNIFIGNPETREGYFENFERAAPPDLPDSDWTTGGDGNWGTVYDPAHADDRISVKSGAIDNNQVSIIMVSKYSNTPGGYLLYRIWIDAAPGNVLKAFIHYGQTWILDAIFLGEGISFPANHSNSIAVGASNDSDLQSPYSQWGEEIDFVAPSSGGSRRITTTDISGRQGENPTNYMDNFGGTSSAAPLAAGIAALLLSMEPDLTASEVRTIMRDTCEKIGNDGYDDQGAGWNKYYGYGRVNAHKAIAALAPNAALAISSSAGGCFVSSI